MGKEGQDGMEVESGAGAVVAFAVVPAVLFSKLLTERCG